MPEKQLRIQRYKKFLHSKFYIPHPRKGFTLIELLVVIAIIAILATIGLVIYSGVQKNARDARRRSDIEAISRVLEAHYNATSNANCTGNGGTYCPLQLNWFSTNGGSVPVDPTGGSITTYCIWPGTTGTPSSWTTACPAIGAVPGVAPAVAVPANNPTSWELCASLETVANGVFCLGNQQQ